MSINKIILLFCLGLCLAFSIQHKTHIPDGFVYVKNVIPDLNVQLRYYTSNNFVGDTIDGYRSNKLILSEPAAQALKKVQDELQQENLCLLVYDGYRPQTAVNHFVRWAEDIGDTLQKKEFYPKVKKQNLFNAGYIASKSGHSRGSTVDLTLINGNSGEPLDMGSPYDFFGKVSWVEHSNLTKNQRKNRQKLQAIMKKYNFRNYSKEWWHFTLRWEPYPNTYFDFPIE